MSKTQNDFVSLVPAMILTLNTRVNRPKQADTASLSQLLSLQRISITGFFYARLIQSLTERDSVRLRTEFSNTVAWS